MWRRSRSRFSLLLEKSFAERSAAESICFRGHPQPSQFVSRGHIRSRVSCFCGQNRGRVSLFSRTHPQPSQFVFADIRSRVSCFCGHIRSRVGLFLEPVCCSVCCRRGASEPVAGRAAQHLPPRYRMNNTFNLSLREPFRHQNGGPPESALLADRSRSSRRVWGMMDSLADGWMGMRGGGLDVRRRSWWLRLSSEGRWAAN